MKGGQDSRDKSGDGKSDGEMTESQDRDRKKITVRKNM